MKIVKLGDICLKITDGSHYSPKSDIGGDFPYVTVRDINNDLINFENCKSISTSSYEDLVNNGCRPELGDLLFSKDGTVGKVSLVNFDKDFVVLSSLAIIRPDQSQILPEYLFHILKSSYFLNQAIGRKSGTAIRRIILRDLKNIEIAIEEDLEEQRRVVVRLDAAFEKISAAEVLMRQNLDNVAALQKSILHKYLSTSGNTHTNRLSTFFDVRDGTHDSPSYHATGYPLVTSKNLKTGHLSMDKIKLISKLDYDKINERSKVDAGDVLMAMIGTVGNPILIEQEPEFAIKNVALFKPINNNSGKFLKYYLQSEATNGMLQKDARGTTQKFVSLGYLRDLPFPDIPPDKQVETVEKIDLATTSVEKLMLQFEQKLEKIGQLRQSLLQEALSTTK